MRVKLVSVNTPVQARTRRPELLPYLAVKTSSGKIREHGLEHYLDKIVDDEKLERYLMDAVEKYPVILEHIYMTFFVEDISRVCSHQLVRHRLATYTQESQRYSEKILLRAVDASSPNEAIVKYTRLLSLIVSDKPIISDTEARRVIRKVAYIPSDIDGNDKAFKLFAKSLIESIIRYFEIRLSGVLMESARYILPQAIYTSILMTVNLRELLHIHCLRSKPEAQEEIRLLARKLLDAARETIPCIEDLAERFCYKYGYR